MVILKNKKAIPILVTIFAVLSVSFLPLTTIDNTSALSKACRNSSACMEAVEQEKIANENAANAKNSASLYQAKVNELSAEIATKQAEIADTEAQIAELTKEIEETEAKLKSEQEALAELLVNMHFEGDTEPIRVLASSNSISDLAEKQARDEVVKQEISASAVLVKQTKEKLEADKASVEQLLSQQQYTKEQLEISRNEQRDIVSKYQNDAAAYDAAAKEAKEAQRKAEQAEQEAHPELYRGSSFTGVNTYPWQNDCPHRQDDYLTYWQDAYGYHKIGGYVCECVSYAGWKAYEEYGVYLAWGNAYSWDDTARALGYTVDRNPAPGTIGQADGGAWGHVFWVEDVNWDGSINVTEYNNAYATYLYSGNYRYGDFGSRKISAGELWQYNFIHF